MEIRIKLFASLRTGRFKSGAREYPASPHVGQVVEELGIPEGDLGIILINGRHGTPDQPLADGDCLSLLPRIGGG